ncbi:MAG: DUF2829 domain-containing protein [Propionivibrio sp.]|nr:DUF2829 domain-containing protein [Propionivibrio sp.]
MTKKYIGTKIITAFPETKPANEDHGDIEGYAVVYEDGYRSWSPKATFEAAYRATEGDGQALTFGDAIHLLKQGKKLVRAGWNGKGMYLFLIGVPGSGARLVDLYQRNDNLPLLPFIAMKTAGDEVVPWLASQTDMLADDWTVIE